MKSLLALPILAHHVLSGAIIADIATALTTCLTRSSPYCLPVNDTASSKTGRGTLC